MESSQEEEVQKINYFVNEARLYCVMKVNEGELQHQCGFPLCLSSF